MRTYTPRLDVRRMVARGKIEHDHAVLQAIGCVATAALLYLLFALLWGVDDDLDTLGAIDRAPAPAVVAAVTRA